MQGGVCWLHKPGRQGLINHKWAVLTGGPFVSLLGHDIDMVRQDVPTMLEKVFEMVDSGDTTLRCIEIPPELIPSRNVVS